MSWSHLERMEPQRLMPTLAMHRKIQALNTAGAGDTMLGTFIGEKKKDKRYCSFGKICNSSG